ncbi:unannotated protein [freshwater metagenome]|uniref:Unannotated protein n=1 Tax=freshwater metagenome TaxID=449393 RepID=A0A6J7HLK6_9ZZZZ
MTTTTTSAQDLPADHRGDHADGIGNTIGSNSAALVGEETAHCLATSPRKSGRRRLGLDLGESGHELVTGLLDLILK